MTKPNFETPDMTQKNIDKIAQLFPNCITESKDENGKLKKAVNFELLQQMLSDDIADKDEAYEFTWVGKNAAIVEANKPIRKTLRPCKEESVNWDTTENLYIEGDNLEVLKLLQESYLGKVKMIYIDPPYNTGNDFIYRDDFASSSEEYAEESGQIDDEGNRMFKNTDTNGRFHSDWCSMIYSRLLLARNLLSDDGVIFISIDDNELYNLKKIAENIFGISNFIGNFSVENNPKGRKNSSFISVSSEYCLVFAKNIDKSFFIENVPKKASDMTEDENGRYVHNSGKRVLVGENSFNNFVENEKSSKNYSVYFNKQTYDLKLKKEKYNEIDNELIKQGFKKYASVYGGKLVENTYSEDKFFELFSQKALEFADDKIYEKNFADTIRIKSQLTNKEYEAIVNGKKQNYSMELTTTGAGTHIKNLFQSSVSPFSAPKNIGFMKLLLSLFPKEDFTVLDFFSGSSTMAEAVIRQNEMDGAGRKYIMVQLPEDLDVNLGNANTLEKPIIKKAIEICDELNKPHKLTEVAKQRIRLAGKKIKEGNPLTTQDLDVGFRVLKVDDSNMKDVYYSPAEYSQQNLDLFECNIKEDRNDLDLLFGCLLDWGLPLSLPYTSETVGKYTVHTYNDGDLVACFNEDVSEEVVKEIARKKPLRAVFRDNSFSNSASKINVFEIFKMISPETSVKVI